MKRIVQEYVNGCGMACVAMLVALDYFTTCRELFNSRRGRYSDTKDLVFALEQVGFSTSGRLIRFKKHETCRDIGGDAILKVRPRNRSHGSWHWVVWDSKREKLLDPRKRPYKNPRLYSYLHVYRG